MIAAVFQTGFYIQEKYKVNRQFLIHIWRLVLLLVLQIVVLRRIHLGGESFNYISLYIYPLFLMLLPQKIPQPLLIGIGFVTGLLVDIFYNSPGVHAGTCVFITFFRPFLLNLLEPPSEYKEDAGLTKKSYGYAWFLGYSALFIFLHLFFYFSLEAFTFVHIKEILLRTGSSFVLSWIMIVLYMVTFDPAA